MLIITRFMEEYTREAIDAKGYDGSIPVEKYHVRIIPFKIHARATVANTFGSYRSQTSA